MADEHEDDVLELDNSVQHDEAAETDDIVLEFEGDEQQEETPLIKQLRQRERDLHRENAELRKAQQPKPKIEVGPKPTLESCEYDPDRYEKERDAWDDRKAEAERQQQEQRQAEQNRTHTFDRAMTNYRDQAARLGIKGFEDAETAVKASLPPEVQGVIVQYFKEPAKLVAALGKSPMRLAAISAEPDPMRQIMMLKEAEGAIKMTNRRKPPEPEADTILRGSAPVGGGMTQAKYNKRLDELEAEASRNGGRRNKIREFKAQYKGKFA